MRRRRPQVTEADAEIPAWITEPPRPTEVGTPDDTWRHLLETIDPDLGVLDAWQVWGAERRRWCEERGLVLSAAAVGYAIAGPVDVWWTPGRGLVLA